LVKLDVEFKAKRYLRREKRRLMILLFFQFGVEPSLCQRPFFHFQQF